MLCLAFPLEPPATRGQAADEPPAQLDAAQVPTLVVQGERDRFGIPPSSPTRKVVKVRGDHGLKSDLEAIGSAKFKPGWRASSARQRSRTVDQKPLDWQTVTFAGSEVAFRYPAVTPQGQTVERVDE